MVVTDNKIFEYLQKIESCETSEQVWRTFIDETTKLGVPWVTYGFRRLPQTLSRNDQFQTVNTTNVDSRNHTWVTTAPDACITYWMGRANAMERIDPMVEHIRANMTPLNIGNAFLKQDDPFYKERKALYDVGEASGVKCGYGIPLKQYGTASLGEVVYHTPFDEKDYTRFIQNNGALLHTLAMYMHLVFQPFERCERADSMGIKGRPLEILYLMREGMTNAEIAAHLDLAPATISYHIKDLKQRLNANSTRDIIPLSMRLNIISD